MYKNDDPFAPWNDPRVSDNPFAPHNNPIKDTPFQPWNSPLGRGNDMSESDKDWYRRRGMRW